MDEKKPMIWVGKTRLSLADLIALPLDACGWRTVACGDRARLGDGARLGAGARLGDGARLGYGARLGDGVWIGAGAWIGARARLGDGAQIGGGAWLGDGAQIGSHARGVVADLGCEQSRSYARIAYWGSDGAIRISAGCRDFSLVEARAHWGAGYPGERRIGDEYLAILDLVERVSTGVVPNGNSRSVLQTKERDGES